MHTKEELLLELSLYTEKPYNPTDTSSIVIHADKIAKVREMLKEHTTEAEEFNITSRIKSRLQYEAIVSLDYYGGSGAVLAATGVGKSKIAIDRIVFMGDTLNRHPQILLVVPTEKLRDEGWRNEFEKWGQEYTYTNHVDTICYASLHTVRGLTFDLVILDEFHNITERSAEFFFNNDNTIKSTLCLSATKPDRRDKIDIVKRMGIFPIYKVSLDQAVQLGVTAGYKITIVTTELDNKDEYIRSGKEGNYFYQTEQQKYNFWTKSVNFGSNPMARIHRMKLVAALKYKTINANKILSLIPQDKRMLIFCGSKKQANEVCQYRYYSPPSKPKQPKKITPTYSEKVIQYQIDRQNYRGDADLVDFQNGEINRLACVESLNEGHNIANDLDLAVVIQMNSTLLDIVQRLGRIIRFRPGHIGHLIIIAVRDTVDMDWVLKATKTFDQSKIETITIEELIQNPSLLNYSQ